MPQMEFNYRPLEFNCDCGTKGNYFIQLAVTHDFNLMVQWLCPTCRKCVTAVVPFEQIVRNAPPPPEAKITPSLFDAQFCRDLHITMEAPNAPSNN